MLPLWMDLWISSLRFRSTRTSSIWLVSPNFQTIKRLVNSWRRWTHTLQSRHRCCLRGPTSFSTCKWQMLRRATLRSLISASSISLMNKQAVTWTIQLLRHTTSRWYKEVSLMLARVQTWLRLVLTQLSMPGELAHSKTLALMGPTLTFWITLGPQIHRSLLAVTTCHSSEIILILSSRLRECRPRIIIWHLSHSIPCSRQDQATMKPVAAALS